MTMSIETKYAARSGNLDLLKDLVMNQKHAVHNWALFEASKYGHFSCVLFLVQQNPTIFIHDKCLSFAAHNGHFNILKFLIKHKIKHSSNYIIPFEVIRACVTETKEENIQNQTRCLQFLLNFTGVQIQVNTKVLCACFLLDNVVCLKMIINQIKDFVFAEWLLVAAKSKRAIKCHKWLCKKQKQFLYISDVTYIIK
jgi:hypothetical protein